MTGWHVSMCMMGSVTHDREGGREDEEEKEEEEESQDD